MKTKIPEWVRLFNISNVVFAGDMDLALMFLCVAYVGENSPPLGTYIKKSPSAIKFHLLQLGFVKVINENLEDKTVDIGLSDKGHQVLELIKSDEPLDLSAIKTMARQGLKANI